MSNKVLINSVKIGSNLFTAGTIVVTGSHEAIRIADFGGHLESIPNSTLEAAALLCRERKIAHADVHELDGIMQAAFTSLGGGGVSHSELSADTGSTLIGTQFGVPLSTVLGVFNDQFKSGTTRVIYREGDPGAGLIYPTLYDAAHSLEGDNSTATDINIDSSVGTSIAPSGSLNLHSARLVGQSVASKLYIQDGATFTNFGGIYNLEVHNQASAPAIELVDGTITLLDGIQTQIVQDGTGPLISYSGSTGAYLVLFKAANIVGGAHPLVYVTGSGTLNVVVFEGGQIDDNTFTGNGTVQFISSGAGSNISHTQTGLTGTVGYINQALAERVSYTPSTPSNWNTTPEDTRAALDQLSARVKALEP